MAWPGAAMIERGKLEFVVGIFVLVGILCLGYLAIKLGKLELVGGDYYELTADFSSSSGLKKGASVEIAGVEVGRVKSIVLKEDQAQVVLAIEDGITVYTDAIASIKTRGIIGEKFMGLSPGGAGEPLARGGMIMDTESGIDLEQVISQFIHGNVE
ncbi:MAG: outer membrane lipid asymmetry maintenance protein MlaD [Nitrospirota bacterium]|nr:outer membrane lipid asymmetry maintenance protein MlaD [Nitrospirota bacterium]MDH5585055.1 outer membrane lipid asymmetry maintenance protein MlaD [Nitrospirota bacterium]MDH5773580.1 outer membrane lipid asymmetry maintenance protein MlaD [Nitrospirota bacterium]